MMGMIAPAEIGKRRKIPGERREESYKFEDWV
jgi:hypothetical protein